MNNNYLLESPDKTLIQEKINNLITELGFTIAFKSIYDLEEKDLSLALEDLNTYSFLTPKKIIIIENLFSNINEQKLSRLFKYIENPSSDILLILTCKKLDNRLSITKSILKLKNLTHILIEVDPFTYTKNLFKDYKIDNSTIHLIIELCKNDMTKISSEANKLMIYKLDEKDISKEDVEELVVKKLGDSSEALFAFIKSLLLKNKAKALKDYQELLEYQLDNSSIIGLLASQLRLIYQIKILAEKKLSNDEIAKELEINSSYQVKKMKEYIYDYTYLEISNFIEKLAYLDYNVKSGKIMPDLAIEMLIINL